MTAVKKIDGSVTGLRIAEESTDIGILGGSPIWLPMEPNSYGDFGTQITSVARQPIEDDRQAKKPMVVDLDASGGFQTDFTQFNLQTILQGFFFADLRRKADFGGAGQVTTVTTTYNAAAGLTVFAATDLVFMAGFTNAANNGLKSVTSATATALTVTPAPVAETPPATATITKVGRQYAAGVLDVDASGTLPAITGTNLDQLGLVPGEWVFVGGDATLTHFVNAVNNGFKQVATVAPTRIEFKKSITIMVTESSSSETVQIFIPRTLKNELGALIKRRTYQLERTLGAPDNASPTQIQSQYIIGGVANTLELSLGVANKVELDLAYVGITGEERTGIVGVKSGSRPDLIESDAFNTASDFSLMRVSPVPATGANATPTFGFMTEFKLKINNNAKALKAIGVFGGFDVTVGKFEVDGSLTAYFSDVAAITAVKNNTSVTCDMAMVKNNSGVVVDIPLLTLGDARLKIEQDTEIQIPCSFKAASGAQVLSTFDYTMSMHFFDYLPNLADT